MPRTVSDRTRQWVRRSAEYQFNCTVRIFTNTVPALNTSTGLYQADEGATVYSGTARIWGVDGAGVVTVGDGDYATQVTYCSIPWDVSVPEVDNQIEVMECPGDPALVGRTFRIMSIDGGGQVRATRRMQVVGITENRSWQP